MTVEVRKVKVSFADERGISTSSAEPKSLDELYQQSLITTAKAYGCFQRCAGALARLHRTYSLLCATLQLPKYEKDEELKELAKEVVASLRDFENNPQQREVSTLLSYVESALEKRNIVLVLEGRTVEPRPTGSGGLGSFIRQFFR